MDLSLLTRFRERPTDGVEGRQAHGWAFSAAPLGAAYNSAIVAPALPADPGSAPTAAATNDPWYTSLWHTIADSPHGPPTSAPPAPPSPLPPGPLPPGG